MIPTPPKITKINQPKNIQKIITNKKGGTLKSKLPPFIYYTFETIASEVTKF